MKLSYFEMLYSIEEKFLQNPGLVLSSIGLMNACSSTPEAPAIIGCTNGFGSLKNFKIERVELAFLSEDLLVFISNKA